MQAFRSLWWQHWDPRPHDEWLLHWIGVLGSVLINLGFLFLLIWSLAIRWALPPPTGDEGRVSVSLIGDGSPVSGAVVERPHDAVVAAATSAAVSRSVPPAITPSSTSLTGVASTSAQGADGNKLLPSSVRQVSSKVEVEQPTQPAVEQPLQVTEVAVPTTDFVIPPLQHLSDMSIPIRERSLPQVRQREVQIVDIPPRLLQMQSHDPQVLLPHVAVPSVRERDVVIPDQPQFSMRDPQPVVPTLRPQKLAEVQVRQHELPSVAVPVQSSVATPLSTTPVPVQAPSEQWGEGSAVAVQHDNGGDASRRGDDWGLADRRQRPGDGGQSLFDQQGRVRVPNAGRLGGTSRGAPGSESDTWTRERIAQSGKWLKRPPYDYIPTVFEQYWTPNESLLQQWVSRGIKKIEIPIPGTHTKIHCVVSLLQFGGGCSLINPNMNDQSATARPPPDIPFKKELQEENGSVR
ncbi:hypothetical protein LPH41_07880 [Xylella taiwanensis]|nr:hypothetical protein [Xylella taiwanensis]UFN03807.1 hypothetical protein LPH41_07880 [Xylella taiwanensis]UFN42019.1 hypothetical protein LPH57_04165 [Xylella taiwanensis]